jgi:hypothetical protein
MGIADELRDPWGILVVGIAGGAAWAVGLPVAVAAGVGAAVYGVKTLAGTLVDRRGDANGARPRILPVRGASAEHRWLDRSERAARSFRELADSAPAGPLADRCRAMGAQVATTIEAMQRLAGQVSGVADAMGRVDGERLPGEESRISGELARSHDPAVRTELGRSLESVRSQLDVRRRLEAAARMLMARMEAGALGLEGLVARLAEILALAHTATSAGAGAGQIDALVDELEGLRGGLVESEDVSRRALNAYRATG